MHGLKNGRKESNLSMENCDEKGSKVRITNHFGASWRTGGCFWNGTGRLFGPASAEPI